jgi:hypothetical protein
VRIAVLAGAAAIVGAGAASAQSADATPVVVTVGEAVVHRAPDRAFVSATTETHAKTPRDAQAQNAEAMTAVQAKLRGASLAKDAIRTLGYGVEPEWEFVNNRRQLRGYRAYNTIEVRVDDPNRLGEVVDLIGASGGTSLGDVRFDLKDRSAAERQALADAVADAKARADAAAAGAGRAIGAIVRIVDDGVPSPGPRPMMARPAASVAGSPETPIVGGDIEIRARVTLTATLK